jgi:hypothetical protein
MLSTRLFAPPGLERAACWPVVVELRMDAVPPVGVLLSLVVVPVPDPALEPPGLPPEPNEFPNPLVLGVREFLTPFEPPWLLPPPPCDVVVGPEVEPVIGFMEMFTELPGLATPATVFEMEGEECGEDTLRAELGGGAEEPEKLPPEAMGTEIIPEIRLAKMRSLRTCPPIQINFFMAFPSRARGIHESP